MDSEYCNFDNVKVIRCNTVSCNIKYKDGKVVRVLDDDFRKCFEMPPIIKEKAINKIKNNK